MISHDGTNQHLGITVEQKTFTALRQLAGKAIDQELRGAGLEAA